jgi:disulfide bond formation protein DsbB
LAGPGTDVLKSLIVSMLMNKMNHQRKAEAPWSAPTGKCSSAKKVRILTFIAEGYLTRAVTIIALASHDCYKILKED